MDRLNCAHCSASLTVPSSIDIATVRCARCGAVHHRDGEVISPRMFPLYDGVVHCYGDARMTILPTKERPRASPWMDRKHRPIHNGYYDVRYRDGTQLIAWWQSDIRRFTTFDSRAISDHMLVCWQGSWE